jgi:hypothetical protein
MVKDKPINEAARAVSDNGGPHCSDDSLRRLDRLGIVKPGRDPWGRRLFGADDIAAARRYLARHGLKRAV